MRNKDNYYHGNYSLINKDKFVLVQTKNGRRISACLYTLHSIQEIFCGCYGTMNIGIPFDNIIVGYLELKPILLTNYPDIQLFLTSLD